MQGQTAPYDLADIEDRYEKRLREMIQAKLEGEGIASRRKAAKAPAKKRGWTPSPS